MHKYWLQNLIVFTTISMLVTKAYNFYNNIDHGCKTQLLRRHLILAANVCKFCDDPCCHHNNLGIHLIVFMTAIVLFVKIHRFCDNHIWLSLLKVIVFVPVISIGHTILLYLQQIFFWSK